MGTDEKIQDDHRWIYLRSSVKAYSLTGNLRSSVKLAEPKARANLTSKASQEGKAQVNYRFR